MSGSAELKPHSYFNYLIIYNIMLLLLDFLVVFLLLSKWSYPSNSFISQLDKLSQMPVFVIMSRHDGVTSYVTISVGSLAFMISIGYIAVSAILLWKGFAKLIDYGPVFRIGYAGAGLFLISVTSLSLLMIAISIPILLNLDVIFLFAFMYPVIFLVIFIAKSVLLRMEERGLDSYLNNINILVYGIILFLVILGEVLTFHHNILHKIITIVVNVFAVIPLMHFGVGTTSKTLKGRLLASAGIAIIFSIIPLFIIYLFLWLVLVFFSGFALIGLAYSNLGRAYRSIPLRTAGVLMIIEGKAGLIITIVEFILSVLNLTQIPYVDSIIESFNSITPELLVKYMLILIALFLTLQQLFVIIGLNSIKRRIVTTITSEITRTTNDYPVIS